jgi:ATP-dependent Clp protease ATP-binding subunit ClpA
LGVLDKAQLRLGDNTTVSFERSLIFLTSNLGSRDMLRAIQPDFGFQALTPEATALPRKLQKIGLVAVRRKFSPEFVNRIDVVITYQPLAAGSLAEILEQQLRELEAHIVNRLGPRAFHLELSSETRRWLLARGTSPQYGARELKRTIHRNLTQPLAAMVAAGEIEPGDTVQADVADDGDTLRLTTEPEDAGWDSLESGCRQPPLQRAGAGDDSSRTCTDSEMLTRSRAKTSSRKRTSVEARR